MAKFHIQSRLKRALRKVTKPQSGWLDESDKVIGLANGTVLTGVPGMIYVRDPANGQVLTVYNTVAPTDRPGLQVRVGKLVGESIYRVKGMRDSYGIPAGGSSGSDHSHENLFISRERFLPFIVLPISGGGHVVQIYGDLIIKADRTFTWIEHQTLDLSSSVPTDGTAKYVLIEADDDGVINVVDGTPVAAKELLTPADIPAHTDGSKPSCAVRLFDGQTQLYRDPASINDFVDVRSLTSGGGGGSGSGDMTKAVYDTDDDGVVEAAVDALDSILWNGFAIDPGSIGDGQVPRYDAGDFEFKGSNLLTSAAVSSAVGELVAFNSTDGQEIGNTGVLLADLLAGWRAGTGTWSYTSADDPTFVMSVPDADAALMNPGYRIKLTQTSAKYFIVTAKGSPSGGFTPVTIYGGTDYDLANAAITSPYYSPAKAPLGFPLSPAKWTVTVTNTSTHTQASPTASQWYNLGSISIDIPIGVWEVTYDAYVASAETGTQTNINVTLSTANNTQSNAAHTMASGIRADIAAGVVEIANNFQKSILIELSSKTTHYLNERVNVFTVNSLSLLGAISTTTIKAVCAYL